MAKRAPSAYFLFCEEERASARQACTSADASGKVSVAIVAKELGKRWEALPAERRQTYKDRAQQRALEAQTAQKEPSQSAAIEEKTASSGFALSLVRRIMLLDPEVNRISSDAVRAIAKAAELMIEQLATKAHSVASSNKRSTVRFTDVDRAVRSDHRYVDMGLKECFATEDLFASARGQDTVAAKGTKKPSEPTQKGRPIAEYFRSQS